MMNNKNRHIILKAIFLYYILFLIWILLFKFEFNIEALKQPRVLNLIPFKLGIINNPTFNKTEIMANIIAFIPFGLLINNIQNKKTIHSIIFAFLLSLAIETLQYTLAIGQADLTDFITNTTGAIIGTLLYKIINKIFKKKELAEQILIYTIAPMGLISGIVLIILVLMNQ